MKTQTSFTSFVRTHALAAFFILAFAWAWGCWSYLVITTPPGGMQAGISPAFFLLAILGGFGPSLAAIVLSVVLDGRAGVKELFGQVRRWRIALNWYAIALLLVPAVSAAGLVLQSAVLGKTTAAGDVLSRLALGLVWPLFASLGEEFGWRGFAQPRLQLQRGPLAAGLWIGLIWGMWHLPSDFIALRAYGPLFIPAFILSGPVLLSAHAVILAWLYDRTRSLLPVVLYHFSITSSAILLPTLQLTVVENIAATFISCLLFWVAAGGILWSYKRAEKVSMKLA
jgi:uncharacterized protein